MPRVPESPLFFYRVATVGLLLVVALLGGLMLVSPEPPAVGVPGTGTGGGERAATVAGLAPDSTAPVTRPSGGAGGGPPVPGVEWIDIDLTRKLAQLQVLVSDLAVYDELVNPMPPATTRVRVLGFGQDSGFGFDRRQTVATLVVSGEGVLRHVCTADGQPVDLPLVAGDVAVVPSYCGHRWVNGGTDNMLSLLSFETPSALDPNISTRVQCEESDPRARLGGPVVHVPASEVLAGGTWLGGRLRSVVVGERLEFVGSATAVVSYVLRGQVSVTGEDGGVHEWGPGGLSVVPVGRSFVMGTSSADSVVMVFDPAQDGVSPIVRGQRSEFSQGFEEVIIRAEFGDARERVFLDVGSAHARELSTTYYLEARLGWRGLAIDAQREYAAEYAEHRPNTRFVSYFVSDRDDEAQAFFRDARVPVVGSSSAAVAREQVEQAVGATELEELSVQTISLNTLLVREGIDRVDFVSMDIEEHEPAALRGFDIGRYGPALVCVESHGRTQDALYAYFAANGYRRLDQYLAYDPVNWYFAPVDGQ